MSRDKTILLRSGDITVDQSTVGEYVTLISEGGDIVTNSVTIDGIKNLSLMDSVVHTTDTTGDYIVARHSASVLLTNSTFRAVVASEGDIRIDATSNVSKAYTKDGIILIESGAKVGTAITEDGVIRIHSDYDLDSIVISGPHELY